jgi:hypothetical protein
LRVGGSLGQVIEDLALTRRQAELVGRRRLSNRLGEEQVGVPFDDGAPV